MTSPASTRAQAGAQCLRSRQRRGDASLALLALPRQLVEDRCGIRVGAGSAHEDAVDGCGPGVDVDADGCEPCQRVLRARRVQERAHVTPFRDRNRLVVAGDRRVEEGLEDALLRREQPIDRGLRDLGRAADPLDGRRAVSALEEEGAGGIEHRPACQPCPRLRRPRPVVCHRWDRATCVAWRPLGRR